MNSFAQFPNNWRAPQTPAFGTFPFPFKQLGLGRQEVEKMSMAAITDAIEVGCRHIDTAFTYCNQEQIGTAVKSLGLKRQEIFVTGKLHPYNNSYKEAEQKIVEAINLIWGKNVDGRNRYLDSFLIHYPGFGEPSLAYKALQEARTSGLLKHIGVSNFEIKHLESLKKDVGEFPEVNQIEFHPWIYNDQVELIDFCKTNNIMIEGYSPLAQGKAFGNPQLTELAQKYQTSEARILLKWCMQHGVLPIVGSRKAVHIQKNFSLFKFDLSRDETQSLNDFCQKNQIRVAEQWNWNPQKVPFGGLKPPISTQKQRNTINNIQPTKE